MIDTTKKMATTSQELFRGDCLEVVPKLQCKVDLVLTDPPYGTTACKWDTVIPFDNMWEMVWGISNTTIFTSSQPFTSALVMSQVRCFKHEWIWKKNMGSNFGALKTNPFKEHESVLVFSKKTISFYPIREERSAAGRAMVEKRDYSVPSGGDFIGTKFKNSFANRDLESRHPSSVQSFSVERGFHPTQKPVALLEYLIKTYTQPGDTVLDFAMGSGSTGVAAINTGRNFIGVEKNYQYFKIAKQRVEEALDR